MDIKTLKSLEFYKILESVSKHAASLPAKNYILSLTPSNDIIYIENSLNEIEEALVFLQKYSSGLYLSFDDVTEIIIKSKVISILTNYELIKISRFIKNALNIKTAIKSVDDERIIILKTIINKIVLDLSLAIMIDESIISDTEISDNASKLLKDIRKKKAAISEKIKKTLDFFISSPTYSKVIQETLVTIRNDRYVIPVKAEFKSIIPGLIHDQSSTGLTYFIEPMVIVELNNQLKTLILEENIEIERILRDFTVKISAISVNLEISFNILILIDSIFAKTHYAYETKSVKPTINQNGYIEIIAGRHPLLNKNLVIPTNVVVGKKYMVLLITGPNTGGKTVVLKLVGLLESMAMTGLYVPADKANLAIFDNIYCDIGDEQSIEQSLSTFSSHIKNIKFITDNVTENSLVLLDELGAGTDPTEGASLAVAILNYIILKGARSIITTHYNELKEFAFINDSIENASMDFDPKTFYPTYNLIIGTPGRSNAIEIAHNIGLNKDIIDYARAGMKRDEKHIEALMKSLEDAKINAKINENKTKELLSEAQGKLTLIKEEAKKLQIQRQKLSDNASIESNILIKKSIKEADNIIAQLKTCLENPSEENLFIARTLKSKIKKLDSIEESAKEYEYNELKDNELSIGSSVKVIPLNVIGKIIDINKKNNSATVITGKIKSIFKNDQLIPVLPQQSNEVKIKGSNTNVRNIAFSPELKIIGLTVFDAIHEVDIFLNQAIQSSISTVKIIHGYGTGKLREGIRAFLKKCVFVDTYQDGDYTDGGRGVTIVTFKK